MKIEEAGKYLWHNIGRSGVWYDTEIKGEYDEQRYNHSDTKDVEYYPAGLAKPVPIVDCYRPN